MYYDGTKGLPTGWPVCILPKWGLPKITGTLVGVPILILGSPIYGNPSRASGSSYSKVRVLLGYMGVAQNCGTFLGVSYNKHYNIWCSMLGSPHFRKLPCMKIRDEDRLANFRLLFDTGHRGSKLLNTCNGHMSYNLNSLKEVLYGIVYGALRGILGVKTNYGSCC